MSTARIYGQFSKIEQLADGTLYVEGIASSESVDSAGEMILASAIKAALPDYLKFPALREMHETWAAGRTVRAEVRSDGTTHIAAKVVDTDAARKVREGVYNGFSIGGNVTKRNASDSTVIEGLTLTEISLVDRPANPDCIMQLVKMEQLTMPTEAAKIEKPSLRKFLGQETFDARAAIEALATIQSLLAMELSESSELHPEAPGQIADLQAAIARIKTFVASEILERDPAEIAAVDSAAKPEVDGKVAALPPAVDGSGAPPPPTDTQITAAASTGDLSKMDSGVAAAMGKAIKAHRAKMEKMHGKIVALAEEFSKLGWREEKAEAEAEAEEKAGEAVDDEKPADGEKPDPAGENPEAKPGEAPAAGEKPAESTDAKPEEKCSDKAAKPGDLAKRLADSEKLANDAGTALAKVMRERDELLARVAARGALRAVPKGDDTGLEKRDDTETPKDTLSLIRAAHARPVNIG